MNDDWFTNIFRDYALQRSAGSPMNTQNIYDMLKNIDIYKKKDTDMAYTHSRYDTTRGDEVATAVLEAYANGIPFETFLKKNIAARQYWHQVQHEKNHAEMLRQAHQERQRKLAEKRAIEQAKREEAMQKLTPEELEAFGFKAKGKRK